MGKTMKKSTVIWGDKHSVPLAGFTNGHLAEIEKLIRDDIGPKAAFDKAAASRAVQTAKNNPKMKGAYVKVGMIDGHMVLRVKEKKFFGDIEVDATLVTDFKGKTNTYIQELLDEMEQETKRMQAEKERKGRLKEVMERRDKNGDTLRDRLLRAAETAQKLGIGNYAQTKLKMQGLQPMDPMYHGEVLDRQKNRYGRFLPALKKVWDDKVDGKLSFSEWLDAVEGGVQGTPGLDDALKQTSDEVPHFGAPNKKVIQPGGVVGGLMVYLDDEARKGYAATASKGNLTGPTVKSGQLIFVIGPDSKLYVNGKGRAQPGERKAFNHSSFFSGGPVKSAGTITVAGGEIKTVNDQSGHYAPTRAMTLAAVRKFGGGDEEWLDKVKVTQAGKTTSGRDFVLGARQDEGMEIWGKYNIGRVNSEDAEAYLKAAPDGSWLIREARGNAMVFTSRNGATIKTDFVRNIGGEGLDRKKLLTKDKLPKVTLPSQTTAPITPPTRRTAPTTKAKTQTTQTAPQNPPTPPKSTLSPAFDLAVRQSPAWHGNINHKRSDELLEGKPNAWLLRPGSTKLPVFSRNLKGTISNFVLDSDEQYQSFVAWTRSRQGTMLRP